MSLRLDVFSRVVTAFSILFSILLDNKFSSFSITLADESVDLTSLLKEEIWLTIKVDKTVIIPKKRTAPIVIVGADILLLIYFSGLFRI